MCSPPPPPCGGLCAGCGDTLHSETVVVSNTGWSYVVVPPFQLCARAGATAIARVAVLGSWLIRCGVPGCAIPAPCDEHDETVSQFDTTQNLCIHEIHVDALIDRGVCGFSRVKYDLTPTQGTKTNIEVSVHRIAARLDLCDEPFVLADSTSYALGVGVGFVFLPGNYQDVLDFTRHVNLGVQWNGAIIGGLYLGTSTRIRAIRQDTFLLGRIETPTNTTPVLQGVLAIFDDGSVIRLGSYTSLTLTTTGSSASLTGDLIQSVYSPGSPSDDIWVRETSESFDSYGDTNRDGKIRWIDRGIILLKEGLTVGQWGYSASADLNLDGEINADDRILFDTYLPICVADVDDGSATGTPDGGVTIDDLTYYMSLFDSGLPDADLDDGTAAGRPDGGVTIEDLVFFLDRFDAGC